MDTVGSSIRKGCRENSLSLLHNIQDLKWEGWQASCNLILGISIIWGLGWSVGASTCGLSVWLGFLPVWRTLGSQTVCGASGIQTGVFWEQGGGCIAFSDPTSNVTNSCGSSSATFFWSWSLNKEVKSPPRFKGGVHRPNLSIGGASSLYHRKAGGMGIIV